MGGTAAGSRLEELEMGEGQTHRKDQDIRVTRLYQDHRGGPIRD